MVQYSVGSINNNFPWDKCAHFSGSWFEHKWLQHFKYCRYYSRSWFEYRLSSKLGSQSNWSCFGCLFDMSALNNSITIDIDPYIIINRFINATKAIIDHIYNDTLLPIRCHHIVVHDVAVWTTMDTVWRDIYTILVSNEHGDLNTSTTNHSGLTSYTNYDHVGLRDVALNNISSYCWSQHDH